MEKSDIENDNFLNKMLYSVVLKAIPCYITIILGLIRYLAIKNDAIIGDISYSNLMKAKLIISYLFGLMYLAPIVMAFTVREYWLYTHHFFSFTYAIYSIVWFGLAILMSIEQERRLTQAWYWHKFFWVTNWLCITGVSIAALVTKVYTSDDYAAYSFMFVEFLLSVLTVSFMLKTKSMRLRRLEQRTLSNNISNDKAMLKSLSPGSIHISLEYRINRKDEVNFKLMAGKITAKVKRNLREFFQIEEYLQRHLEKNMPEMWNLIPSIEKPKLTSGKDHTSIYERRLKSIDNFLQTVADTPELWSRDVLIFIGIDKGTDQAIFLNKRQESIQNKRRGIVRLEHDEKANPFGLPIEDNMSYNQSNSSLQHSDNELMDHEQMEISPRQQVTKLRPLPLSSHRTTNEEK